MLDGGGLNSGTDIELYKSLDGRLNYWNQISSSTTSALKTSSYLAKVVHFNPTIFHRLFNHTIFQFPPIKMQLSTFALASLLSLASARIVGFSVPKTIRPGEGFSAVIHTENYIQTVQDIAIAFGVTPGVGYPGSLGTTLESFYLGPSMSSSPSLALQSLEKPSLVHSMAAQEYRS